MANENATFADKLTQAEVNLALIDKLTQAEVNLALIQEQVVLLQRLTQIESQLNGDTAVAIKATIQVEKEPANNGAAKQAETATATAKRRGRPAGTGKQQKKPNEGKSLKLPALMKTILESVGKPLTAEDITTKVLEAGYKSSSEEFGRVVYQTLRTLVNNETLKVNDKKEYSIA